jgi:hypothetical protein
VIFSNPCIYVFWIVSAAKPCQYRVSAFKSAYTPQTRGKAEIVVQDAASYQKLLELIDRAEAIEGIQKGLESMQRGEGKPAQEVFTRLRKKHNIQHDA